MCRPEHRVAVTFQSRVSFPEADVTSEHPRTEPSLSSLECPGQEMEPLSVTSNDRPHEPHGEFVTVLWAPRGRVGVVAS